MRRTASMVSKVTLAIVLSTLFAMLPPSAQAASIYDVTYKSTANLVQKGYYGCSDQDITYNWSNYLSNDEFSGVKESFALGKSQGKWGVSVSYGAVEVFWTEDTSLYLDWMDPVYGGGYSVMAKGDDLHRAEFSLNGYYSPKPCVPYVSSYTTNASAGTVIADKFGNTKNLFLMTSYPNYPPGYEGTLLVTSEPKATYAAMGDSFSGGEGNPAFEPGSAQDSVNECHRSPQAYPRLVQNALNLGPTAFVACSGATTNDVLGIPEGDNPHGKWNEPAQINALSDETEVVTITIGGNDVGFGNFGYECLFPVNLTHGTCDEFTDIYEETVWKINNELPDKVENVYGALLSEAPNADIYVLGYPHIAPYKTIEDVFDQDCGGLYDEFPNNWGDARAAHEITNLLNEVIEDAVIATNTQYSTDRLEFVPVDEGAFAGHDACSDDSYFHGIVVPDTEYSVHPDVDGQEAYAADLSDAMS
jgi:lysophospholipase L1-like esterase